MPKTIEGHYEKQYENIVQSNLYKEEESNPNSEWILEWVDIRGNESAKSFKTNQDACTYYLNLKYGNQEVIKTLNILNKKEHE